MNAVTKGVVGLVLWLLAGFAVTEVAMLVLSRGAQKPVATPSGRAEPNQTVASAHLAD
jgi:hypothetical protein